MNLVNVGSDYVFWRYDQYPYVLGGVVKSMPSDDRVEVYGYEGCHFTPLRFLPPSEGRALRKVLETLRAQHAEAKRTFEAEWRDRVYAAVPFGIG